MKQILIFTTSMLFLIGCGGGESSSESTQDVNMVIAELNTVYPGNKIIKNTEGTIVQVTHIDGESESTVILVEGNATIIRKP